MPELPSVIPSLTAFGGHWAAAVVLFVVLFAALIYLFARDRVAFLLAGFVRIVASFFSSPFVFLHRTVLRLADFGDKGDTEYRSSRLYLVNKLLLALHAIIIVVALAGLTATLIATWYAFLPPEYLRRAVATLEERITRERAELAPVDARVKQLDQEWQASRQSLVDKFKTERQQNADAAAKANREIEAAAANNPELATPLGSVRGFLDQVPQSASGQQVDRSYQSVVDFTGRLSLEEAARSQLVRYAENWRTERRMRAELAGLTEVNLRAATQPDYAAASRQATALAEQIRSAEEDLARVRAQLKYSPGAAMVTLVLGLLGFIFTVWVVGLFIEVVSLSVHMADDIRRLREASEHPALPASITGTPASLS